MLFPKLKVANSVEELDLILHCSSARTVLLCKWNCNLLQMTPSKILENNVRNSTG